MKGFHKNSRRIENEVFILYMPDHELVTASNLHKNPNCFERYIETLRIQVFHSFLLLLVVKFLYYPYEIFLKQVHERA